jgi:phosphoenolpyruvate carboxykinase (GTP)
MQSNPNALVSCRANSMFTNVGMTDDLDVYWEGMDVMPKGVLTDWKRRIHWKPTLVCRDRIYLYMHASITYPACVDV